MAGENRLRDIRKLALGWRWRLGYMVGTPVPAEYEDELVDVIKRVRRQTMTTAQRIAALCDSVEYLVRSRIEGAIVECGVWKGGSMMAVALTLNRLGETDRDLYLFDTFTGLPQPGTADCSSPYDGYDIHRRWRRKRRSGWVSVPGAEVRRNLESTGYPPEHIHLVEGMVEETVPEHAPERIALLRLDTDWYESTRHELEHLYPRLVPSGVLIVDDYGHYEGARRAVDEFLATSADPVLLNRIDYTGRVAVKPAVDLGAAPGGAR
jgi:O-methyltransferase